MKPKSPPHQSTLITTPAAVIKVARRRYNNNACTIEFDQVICEEPLQITLCWFDSVDPAIEQSRVFTITMRTPGDDFYLALGLLLAEGQIGSASHIDALYYQSSEDDQQTLLTNQLVVQFKRGFTPVQGDFQRQVITHASCGICGTTNLKSLILKAPNPLDTDTGWLDPAQLVQLPQKLLSDQPLFSQTGGVHAAALFDQNYQLMVLKEDIGRHNAVDKVIGYQLTHPNAPDSKQILLVSGRVSFELVQKAIIAGFPVLIAVGAPSSLAISAAQQFDLTLIGFTKRDSFNVYHGHWRLM